MSSRERELRAALVTAVRALEIEMEHHRVTGRHMLEDVTFATVKRLEAVLAKHAGEVSA